MKIVSSRCKRSKAYYCKQWFVVVRCAGIVHQHCDLAEGGIGLVLRGMHVVELADVCGHGTTAGRRDCRDLSCGAVERLGRKVGQAYFQPHRSETARGGETNAARGAGDDGDAAGGEGGVEGMVKFLR